MTIISLVKYLMSIDDIEHLEPILKKKSYNKEIYTYLEKKKMRTIMWYANFYDNESSNLIRKYNIS